MRGEPYILESRGFKICRETERGRMFWAAKHGTWVGCGFGKWQQRSRFHTREAAELELNRLQLQLTPDVPKRDVASATEEAT